MTDSRLRDLDRRALAGDPEARVAALRERLRSQDRPCATCGGDGGAPTWRPEGRCGDCGGSGLTVRPLVDLAAFNGYEPARQAIGPKVVKRRRGLVCCCGSEENASEHRTLEDYTHGFVHACDYAEIECGCDYTEEDEEWWPARPAKELSTWLSGLSRWGPIVMVRAAVAAARVALEVWEQSPDGCASGALHCAVHAARSGPEFEFEEPPFPRDVIDCPTCTDHRPRRAIEAAEAWIADPSEEHHAAWAKLTHDAIPWPEPWVPCAEMALPSVGPDACSPAGTIKRCADLAGEQPVRAAIQSALIAYALERLA